MTAPREVNWLADFHDHPYFPWATLTSKMRLNEIKKHIRGFPRNIEDHPLYRSLLELVESIRHEYPGSFVESFHRVYPGKRYKGYSPDQKSILHEALNRYETEGLFVTRLDEASKLHSFSEVQNVTFIEFTR